MLAPGAVADLVVLDRDPFAGPTEEIGAASVTSTWVEGDPVFARLTTKSVSESASPLPIPSRVA